MMTFGANIAHIQNGLSRQLAFDGKEIVLRIRIGIRRNGCGHAGLRVVNAVENDACIRMAGPGVERGKRKRIRGYSRGAVGQVVGRCKQRIVDRIAQPVGRLRLVNANRIALNYRVKYPVACPDAGLRRSPKTFPKSPLLWLGEYAMPTRGAYRKR